MYILYIRCVCVTQVVNHMWDGDFSEPHYGVANVLVPQDKPF